MTSMIVNNTSERDPDGTLMGGVPLEVAVDPDNFPNRQFWAENVSDGYYSVSRSGELCGFPADYTVYVSPSRLSYQFTGDFDRHGAPIYRLVERNSHLGHPDHA